LRGPARFADSLIESLGYEKQWHGRAIVSTFSVATATGNARIDAKDTGRVAEGSRARSGSERQRISRVPGSRS
jgi:hypothetical protein